MSQTAPVPGAALSRRLAFPAAFGPKRQERTSGTEGAASAGMLRSVLPSQRPDERPVSSTPSLTPRVLLAQDDRIYRQLLTRYLEQRGHWVTWIASGAAFDLELYGLLSEGESNFDVVVSDVRAPVGSGVQVANTIHREGWSLPMILITASPDSHMSMLAAQLDAQVLVSPFPLQALAHALASAAVSQAPQALKATAHD